jgi:RES domain-containing protein
LTEVFRIGFSAHRQIDAQAFGSTLAAGRWHSLRAGPRPRRVVYAASSRSLAQLEKRVHANGRQPVDQALFRLVLPSGLRIRDAAALGLSAAWRDDEDGCRAFGNAWLDAAADLALWVPSFVEPLEYNLLINPDHPRAAQIVIHVERDPFTFDPRLV